MDMELRRRLAALGAWADRLAEPTFRMGEWAGGDRLPDGSITMPWYAFSAVAEAFLADVTGNGWVEPFDWMAWLGTEHGRRLRDEPDAVRAADTEDLRHLLTAIVRSERFGEGNIAGAFDSGLLLAICRRAKELAANQP